MPLSDPCLPFFGDPSPARPAVANRNGPHPAAAGHGPKSPPPRRAIPRTKGTEAVADTPLGKRLTGQCLVVLQERIERAMRHGRLDVLDDHVAVQSVSLSWPELGLFLEILFPEDYAAPPPPRAWELPGSAEKVAVLEARYAARRALFRAAEPSLEPDGLGGGRAAGDAHRVWAPRPDSREGPDDGD